MNPSTEQNVKTGASLALALANIFLPGSGTALAVAPIAIKGVFDLYDAIMGAKPPELTVEEWRARLTDPAIAKSTDDYLNEARRLTAQDAPPTTPESP